MATGVSRFNWRGTRMTIYEYEDGWILKYEFTPNEWVDYTDNNTLQSFKEMIQGEEK